MPSSCLRTASVVPSPLAMADVCSGRRLGVAAHPATREPATRQPIGTATAKRPERRMGTPCSLRGRGTRRADDASLPQPSWGNMPRIAARYDAAAAALASPVLPSASWIGRTSAPPEMNAGWQRPGAARTPCVRWRTETMADIHDETPARHADARDRFPGPASPPGPPWRLGRWRAAADDRGGVPAADAGGLADCRATGTPRRGRRVPAAHRPCPHHHARPSGVGQAGGLRCEGPGGCEP